MPKTEVGPRQRLPDWIVGEILIETIRLSSMLPSIEDVIKRLAKRGSVITKDQVKQVFEEHKLEKKLWIDYRPIAQNIPGAGRKAGQSRFHFY